MTSTGGMYMPVYGDAMNRVSTGTPLCLHRRVIFCRVLPFLTANVSFLLANKSPDTIKRNIFHPSLVNIGSHRTTQSLEMLVGMVTSHELREGLALHIFLCLHLNRNNSPLCLHQEIYLNLGIVFAEIIYVQVLASGSFPVAITNSSKVIGYNFRVSTFPTGYDSSGR